MKSTACFLIKSAGLILLFVFLLAASILSLSPADGKTQPNDNTLLTPEAAVAAPTAQELLKKKFKFPYVTTAHWTFKVTPLLKLMTNWGENVIAVSEDIKEYLIKNYGIKSENIFMFYIKIWKWIQIALILRMVSNYFFEENWLIMNIYLTLVHISISCGLLVDKIRYKISGKP